MMLSLIVYVFVGSPMLVISTRICPATQLNECTKEFGETSLPANQFPGTTIAYIERSGWQLIFRATSGNGKNVYKAWTTGTGATSVKPTSMARSYDAHYRNTAIDAWGSQGIKYVKVALYKNEREVAYIIFSAQDSNNKNWFDKSRVVASSWSDMTPDKTYNYFSVDGHTIGGRHERRFFINYSYAGCPNDLGHLVVVETTGVCAWDKQPHYPAFLYSDVNGADYWERRQFGRADYLAIFALTC